MPDKKRRHIGGGRSSVQFTIQLARHVSDVFFLVSCFGTGGNIFELAIHRQDSLATVTSVPRMVGVQRGVTVVYQQSSKEGPPDSGPSRECTPDCDAVVIHKCIFVINMLSPIFLLTCCSSALTCMVGPNWPQTR